MSSDVVFIQFVLLGMSIKHNPLFDTNQMLDAASIDSCENSCPQDVKKHNVNNAITHLIQLAKNLLRD